jgi:hypothetical protein
MPLFTFSPVSRHRNPVPNTMIPPSLNLFTNPTTPVSGTNSQGRAEEPILMKKPTELESLASLSGPLFDPQCRMCKAEAQHSTWIGRRVSSRFRDHTHLCLDLDDGLNEQIIAYISAELRDLTKEMTEKEARFRKLGKRIECKLHLPSCLLAVIDELLTI